MDKEKKRKIHLVIYGLAIPISLFAYIHLSLFLIMA